MLEIIKAKNGQEFTSKFSQFFRINDRETAQKYPVIFLPGIGKDHRQFDGVIAYLQSLDIQCHAIDWPKFDANNFNFDHHPDYVLSVMERLGWEKAGVFGQSRGGLATIKLLDRYPQTVAFAIINSAPSGYGDKYVPRWLKFTIQAMRDWPRPIIDIGSNILFLIPEFKGFKDFVKGNSYPELAMCYLDHIYHDWRAETAKIDSNIPVVYRYGERDNIVKMVGRNALLELKNGVGVYDPNGDHSLPTPEDIYKIIAYCSFREN